MSDSEYLEADQGYIEMRESLIDAAEKKANKTCGKTRGKKKSEVWADAWNKEFHGQMEKLVRAFLGDCSAEWIIGSEACRQYLNVGSWDTARRWIKRYKAPLRHWIDGRPVFLKREIDEWLKKPRNGESVNKFARD